MRCHHADDIWVNHHITEYILNLLWRARVVVADPSGSKDFLIHVAVVDNDALYAFVIDKLTERTEIADVRTSVVYEHLRNTRVEPVPPSVRKRQTSP